MTRWAVAALAAVIALRFAGLGQLVLFEPSESRYVAIAEHMAATGDWVTPTFPDGTQYLGKPPLHFWWTAVSLAALGHSELAARLPSALAALVLLGAVFALGRRARAAEAGAFAALIAASAVLGLACSALALLDMTFSACLALAFCAFAAVCVGEERSDSLAAGLGFFAALGLAVLAKGPAALAIAGVTIGIWCALERDVTPLRRLPWLGGALVFLAVCAPWYVAAEVRSPGFLRYFLVEENLMRFATATYEDRYGEPHVHPYGMALLFAAAGFLPWSLAVTRRALAGLDSFQRFALAWALACPLLFSASRNLVPQYLLPSLPGLALLLAAAPLPRRSLLAAGGVVCLALGGAAVWGVTHLALEPRGVAALALVSVVGLVTLAAVRADAARVLLATAVIAAAGDFAARAAFRDQFTNASAARLARELERRTELADCDVVYWARRPWSAWFYLTRPTDAVHEHTSLLRAHLGDGRCHVLVFLAKDVERVRPMRRGELLFAHGEYRVHYAAAK